MKKYFKVFSFLFFGICFLTISCSDETTFEDSTAKNNLEEFNLQLSLEDKTYLLNNQGNILMNPGEINEYVKISILPEDMYTDLESSTNNHLVFNYSKSSNDQIHISDFNSDKTEFDLTVIRDGETIEIGRVVSNSPFTAKCGTSPRCWWAVVTIAVEVVIDSFDDEINCSQNAVTACGEGNVDSVQSLYSETVIGEVVGCSIKCK
ncbi:hypothetical protein [Nonlabens sp.]|uniref:hypothetical protein n=1 Tax=Nonlabens sp. TaxID=1888209 RepID=UPI003F697D5C